MNTTYRAYFRNVHLFGQTAEYTLSVGQKFHELGFYYRDRERLPQIVSDINESRADFVGLSEVWDVGMGEEIQKAVREQYPYSWISKGGPGLGGLISSGLQARPWLTRILSAETIKKVTDTFTKGHYTEDQENGGTRGLLAGLGLLTEDRIGRTFSSVLGSNHLWGGGVLFLSKYPIYSTAFIPHPERADWEYMADKGVFWATVRLRENQFLRVAVGHYQEGLSREAMSAREKQIMRTRQEVLASEYPVLVMGDFNVETATPEHRLMLKILELQQATSGGTYRDPNPFQAKLTGLPMSSFKTREMEIDFILLGGGLLHVPDPSPRPPIYSDASDHREITTGFAVA